MDLSASLFSSRKINSLIKSFFGNEFKEGEIPKVLFEETNKQYFDAIDEGFGSIEYGHPDYGFLHDLKTNASVFSAFKNHAQSLEMFDALKDEEGNLRSFNAFKKKALEIDAQYNQQWLNTEYNFAIRSARAASQWRQVNRDKDLYPNLEYMPSLSGNPRESHRQYYGVIKPINDDFWNNMLPPNGWGCACSVQQTRSEADSTEYEVVEQIPGVPGNAGKSRTIWSSTSPFVANLSKKQKEAVKKQYEKLIDDQFDYDIEKVGKNKVWIHKKADSSDFENNKKNARVLAKKEKIDIVVREHVIGEGVKNPELEVGGVVGDIYRYVGNNSKTSTNEAFKKLSKGNQLGELKETFIVVDYQERITDSDVQGIGSQIKPKFEKYKDKLKYVYLTNGDRILRIDYNLSQSNAIYKNIKEELLK